MKIKYEASQKIKNMGLLCVTLVVTMHIGLPSRLDSRYWLAGQLISNGVAHMAVPFFFVVSGFFLAAHFDEQGWWRNEIRKRLTSLVVPFYVWSLLLVMTTFPLTIIADFIANRPFGESTGILCWSTWMRVFGVDLTFWPLHYPLWFVRNLFLLVLLSSVIAGLVRRFKWMWIVFCFLLDLVVTILLPFERLHAILGTGVFSLAGLMYFSFGILIRMGYVKTVTKNGAIMAGLIGCALLGAKVWFFSNSWNGQILLGKFSIPCFLLAVWHFITPKEIPDWLTSCSFPIYLMHIIFFPYVGLALKYLRVDVGGELLMPIVCFVVGVVGSIVLAQVLRTCCPRCASIAYGGRVVAYGQKAASKGRVANERRQ